MRFSHARADQRLDPSTWMMARRLQIRPSMKLLRTISILFGLVAIPAVASAAPHKHFRKTPAQRAMKKLERLDTDNNGALSLAEVKGTRLEKRFEKLDTNDNDILSREELIAGIKEHRQHMKQNKGKHKGKGKNRGVRRGRVVKEA